MSTPKLRRVIRSDSIRLDDTYYTKEGYLVDHPIVTSIGIFEYLMSDGSVRRELRLPEEVFDPASLASYKAKPIIISHDAGTIDKDNVDEEIIGTILKEGYQDGDNVRAEIVIHDTDAMKDSGCRELSLGYSLDLEEKPGIWQGQKYDAIQRNIRVNHLALVDKARAGDQARLNVDGQDKMIGGKMFMSKAQNAALQSSIARFKARRAKRMDEAEKENEKKGLTPEELVQLVKDRRDRRDAEGDPKDTETAMGTIAQQDEDIDTLLEVIGNLMAEKDFGADCDEKKDGDEEKDPDDANADGDDGDDPADGDAGDDDTATDDPDQQEDGDDPDEDENADEDDPDDDPEDEKTAGKVSADRKDSLSEHLSVCRIGDKLHLDGLDAMSITAAKKAVIRKVRPGIRLDGKPRAYIDAAYDMAVQEINSRKSTDFQRKQMMNGAKRNDSGISTADEARQRMIARNQRKEGNK